MEVVLQILFGVVALICLTVGGNLSIKGIRALVPENTAPQPKLDNTFRFLSGMFFSFAFLLIWMIFNIKSTTEIIYLVGVVVACAGLGRLYSRIQVGSAGKYYDVIMVIEVLIGISIIVLQYVR